MAKPKPQAGSNLPAKVELSPELAVWAGVLVNRAFAASGLKVEAWNALPIAQRDEAISKEIESLKELAAQGALPPGLPTVKPDDKAPPPDEGDEEDEPSKGDKEPPASPAKAARGEEVPKTHFLHPDYNGPLTGDQAQQRIARGFHEHRIKGTKPKVPVLPVSEAAPASAEKPAHLREDHSGPLTGDQAMARHAAGITEAAKAEAAEKAGK